MNNRHTQIARVAYDLWERRGRDQGGAENDRERGRIELCRPKGRFDEIRRLNESDGVGTTVDVKDLSHAK